LFDRETGLYFLKTRYYDPQIGRFISQDDVSYLDPEHVNGLNLFAYCGNNPVMHSDPLGNSITLVFLIVGLIAGVVVGGVAGGVTAHNIAAETGATGWELFGWTALGVFGGAIIGGSIGATVGVGLGVLFSGAATLGTVIGSGGLIALVGGGTLGGGTALATVSAGIAIGVGAIASLIGTGLVFMSKPNSGRIRYNDSTGKDPMTGKDFADKKAANEYYKSLKDPVKKANWKRWLKGKGWYGNHLNELIFLPLVGEWLRRMIAGEWW
jgi:RHS repeat-associated protein